MSSSQSQWASYLVGDASQKSKPSVSFVKEIVKTSLAPLPIGPYNQAVKCGGMVYVSGCIGMRSYEDGWRLVPGGVEEEARQVMQNLKAVVEASGSHMNGVVKTTVLLKNMSDFKAVNAIYAQYFDEATAPARACFAVAELPAGSLVEIDAVCAAGEDFLIY